MKTQRACPRPRAQLVSGGGASWHRSRRLAGAVALGLSVVWSCTAAAAPPGRVVVVVNSQGPLTTATTNQIRDIFLGKLRFLADVRTQPVQLAGPARDVVLQRLVGISEREFQLYWARKAYEDGVVPPPVRSTAAEVLQQVEREKGAVGFVDAASAQLSGRVTVVYEFQLEADP